MEKNKGKSKETGAYETFALAGGKKDPKSGASVPPRRGVEQGKEFVEGNKK